jgi:hypothetical protein
MTIFQLMLYSCVVNNGIGGELLSKTCDWRPSALYRVEGKCDVEGSQQHGKPIHEFSVSINSTKRTIEMHKCIPLTVD